MPRTVDWQITRITGKGARYLGQVQAPDADATIRRTIEKFDIAAEPGRGPADHVHLAHCPRSNP